MGLGQGRTREYCKEVKSERHEVYDRSGERESIAPVGAISKQRMR